MFELQTLRAHGMLAKAINIVFQAVVEAMLSYMRDQHGTRWQLIETELRASYGERRRLDIG